MRTNTRKSTSSTVEIVHSNTLSLCSWTPGQWHGGECYGGIRAAVALTQAKDLELPVVPHPSGALEPLGIT